MCNVLHCLRECITVKGRSDWNMFGSVAETRGCHSGRIRIEKLDDYNGFTFQVTHYVYFY